MKNIVITIFLFFAISSPILAQKFIDVYQDGVVKGSMFSSDIDSVSISGTDKSSRRINFWSKGNLSNSFLVNTIDSINVFHSEEEPLVYLGILGFNQELYPLPIDILASSTSHIYSSFVDKLTRKDGTLLYYGIDCALDMLQHYHFTTPLSSVNLITFTDGLDQGSLMMTSKYLDNSDYLSNLSQRIGSTYVRGIPITAYCLGLRGNDVSDHDQFQANLRKLATSDEKSIEVSNMSAVQNCLEEIADQIINISTRQKISMRIPGQSNGSYVCFTFDGNSPENSSIYIEGVFNLKDRSLSDVTYKGIRATSGSVVDGEQEGIFVNYTFTGLQRADGNGLIPTNNIHQYNLAKGSSTWQINSEFTSDNNTQTAISHSGAAIMLVLDCSSSLGYQFSYMQRYAQNFISRVANNASNFSLNPPTNVTATLDEDGKTVNVCWDNVKYAENYCVYRSNNQSDGFILVADSVTSLNWKDESPLYGSNYYKVCAVGHGLTSDANMASVILHVVEIGDGSLENPWNPVTANYFVSSLFVDQETDKDYYIKGKIASIKEEFSSTFGNASFYISEDGKNVNTFYVLRTFYLGNKKWTNGDSQIKVGDEVIICGKLVNYKGNTPETVQNKSYIYLLNSNGGGDGGGGGETGEVKAVTIADFNAAAVSNDVWYKLSGTVKNLKDDDKYGNFDLEDATGSVYVYGLLSEKGGEKQKFQELAAAKGIKNGTKITIIGNRGDYNGKIEVLNAYLVSVDGQGGGGGDDPNPTGKGSYSDPYSVSAAIAAGSGSWVYVKGYIVGCVSGQAYDSGATFNALPDVVTNLLIAESSTENDPSKCMPVQLPSGVIRSGLNLVDNPSNLGKEVLLYGNIEAYFRVPGVKSVTYAEIGGKVIGTKANIHNKSKQRNDP